ncbi:MAG: hypothetical protein M3Z17_02120, partial [Gemmatimonadota bacterium]|nr:hypothetical protein [Gemmatimonadota bacterium]
GSDAGELPGSLILDEMSSNGARLISDNPIAPETTIRFEVPGTTINASGIVRHVRSLETPAQVLFTMGVSLDRPESGWRIPFSRTRTKPRLAAPQSITKQPAVGHSADNRS